jgi:hypothetical protein
VRGGNSGWSDAAPFTREVGEPPPLKDTAMPKEMMPDEGDMDSLYGEGSTSGGEGESPKTIDEKEQEANADTDILKTKVLQSGPDDKVEPGDERVVKVLEVYGDTCKVMYAPKEEESPAEEKSPNEEIDQMSAAHDSAGGAQY